jgi:hypothetical protein
MTKHSSAQERIHSVIASNCIGAASIFAPNDYRKGGGRREPCDLAWLGAQSGPFFWLKESAKANATERNLKQARGAMRAWRKGHFELSGANDRFRFRLPYSDLLHCALVSVSRNGTGWVRTADAHTYDTKAVAIACLPESMMLRMISQGASMLDLCWVMHGMRGLLGELTENECHSVWSGYLQSRLPREVFGATSISDTLAERWPAGWRIIRGLRGATPEAQGSQAGEVQDSRSQHIVFSELTIDQTWTVARVIDDAVRQWGNGTRLGGWWRLVFDGAVVGICIAPWQSWGDAWVCEQVDSLFAYRCRPDRTRCMIVIDPQLQTGVISIGVTGRRPGELLDDGFARLSA